MPVPQNPPRIEDIGGVYDFAIGFPDPSNNNATTMVGYVTAAGQAFSEGADLQDEQHLVQVASPSSSDRFSRYPRVSQGDWTHGEGQLIFTDAQKYYTGVGVDPTKPGQLQLLPSSQVAFQGTITQANATTPTRAQVVNGVAASGPLNLNITPTAGNTLIAFYSARVSDRYYPLTDNQNNVWTKLDTAAPISSEGAAVYYATNVKGAATVITAGVSSMTAVAATVIELANVSTTTAIATRKKVTGGPVGPGSFTLTGGPVTASANTYLLSLTTTFQTGAGTLGGYTAQAFNPTLTAPVNETEQDASSGPNSLQMCDGAVATAGRQTFSCTQTTATTARWVNWLVVVQNTPIGTQAPLVTDGLNWVAAVTQATTNILINGVPFSVGTGNPIVTGLIEAGTVTGAGLIFLANANEIRRLNANTGTSNIVSSDAPSALCNPNMAYYQGTLYYVTGANPSQIFSKAAPGGNSAGVSVFVASVWEHTISCLTSTATGMFFATCGFDTSVGNGKAYLYTFDGATATRVGELDGVVKYAYELNGTTFVLAELAQQTFAQPDTANTHQWTLYSLVGSSLSVVNDLRQATVDFQNTGSVYNQAWAQMHGDDHYLYIAYPGFPGTLAYDPGNNAFFHVGLDVGQATLGGAIQSHRAVKLAPSGLLDLQLDTSGTIVIRQFNLTPTTGYMQTSFVDFTTPTIVKSWDGLEIDLYAPLPTGASLVAQYRTDNNAGYTTASLITTSNSQIVAVCAKGTKGYRIQWQLTLNAGDQGTSPIVAFYSVKGNLGRIWTLPAACRHGQQVRTSRGYDNDPQGLSGVDLLANLENAYLLSGYVTLWIPDPTNPTNANPPLYVAAVQAYIEDFQVKPAPGVPIGYTYQEAGVKDFSTDVILTLVESL